MSSRSSASLDTSSPFTASPSTTRRAPGSPSSFISTPFSASSAFRRTSLYGNEDRIILDIGSAYIKLGFSGEPKPRAVIPVTIAKSDSIHSHYASGCADVCAEVKVFGDLYSLDIASNDLVHLENRLIDYMNDLFFKYLLADPKQRKVIICESPLTPTILKQTIAQVLFKHLQVPSISFLPTHLLALLTTAKDTGLVIDCGHLETTVLPIYCSRPLNPFIASTPIAGKKLTDTLKFLLQHHASLYIPSHYRQTAPLDVPEGILTSELVEDIKTQICFVEPTRGFYSRSGNVWGAMPPEDMKDTWNREEVRTTTKDIRIPVTVPIGLLPSNIQTTIRLAAAPISARSSTSSATTAPKIPPSVHCELSVPGWVRCRAAEVMFEGDDDADSTVQVALECLLRLPRDVRRAVVGGVLLIGGSAAMVGFRERWAAEWRRSLGGRGQRTRVPNRQRPPIANPYAFGLGSLLPLSFFADEPEGSKALNQPPPRVSQAHARMRSDTAPALPPETQSKPSAELDVGMEEDESDESSAEQGSPIPFTPLFNPQLIGWIGGSLIGAVRGAGGQGHLDVTREQFLGAAAGERGGASTGAASAAVVAAAAAAAASTNEGSSGSTAAGATGGVGGLPDWTAIGGWTTVSHA